MSLKELTFLKHLLGNYIYFNHVNISITKYISVLASYIYSNKIKPPVKSQPRMATQSLQRLFAALLWPSCTMKELLIYVGVCFFPKIRNIGLHFQKDKWKNPLDKLLAGNDGVFLQHLKVVLLIGGMLIYNKQVSPQQGNDETQVELTTTHSAIYATNIIGKINRKTISSSSLTQKKKEKRILR